MGEQFCTIGLDIGTTSLKAVSFTADGTKVAEESVRVDTDRDDTGAAIQDPEAIYTCVMDALTKVQQASQAAGYDTIALGFSAAMHSVIPISRDNTPLTRAMIWMDGRAHQEAVNLWNNPLGKDIYQHTGTPIHAMAPIAKLAWLKHQHPSIHERAARFASIKEYVWYRWFGTWEVDHAMASATGMLNLQTQAWYPKALDYAGIVANQLSTPVPTTYARKASDSETLRAIGFGGEVVCCIGGSDGVLASLAAGAIKKDTMVLTIGTSLALRTGASEPIVDPNIRSFCYILDEHHYVLGGPSNNGGVMLDWLYRNIFTTDGEDFDTRFPDLLEAAEHADATGLFCIPYVAGERAPIWDEQAHASFIGLRLHHTQVSMMRAAIEGVLFNAFWIAQGLIGKLGRPERLIVSGKLFEYEWVRQFTADLFQIQIVSEEEADGAILGATELANTAAGRPNLSLSKAVDPETSHPNPASEPGLREKYETYRQLVSAVTGH